MDKSVFFETDCNSILSKLKHQEKQLKLKRRWLLGLSTSKSEHNPSEGLEFLDNGFLPESLLREDDIFYETVKSHVEEAFGICEDEEKCEVVQESEQLFGTHDALKALDLKLDALTLKGLYLIAMITTRGSVGFEKTRQKMKEIVRNSLAKGFVKKKHDQEEEEILRQLHQILNDPRNFQKKCVTNLSPMILSHHDAAAKVLNELENLSFQTLVAMKRKLKCARSIPQLNSRKSGQSRSHLIKQVREASEKMLSKLSEEDELQEPLAKAMALADLSLKLSPAYQSYSAGDFYQFPSDIKNLQDEIVKAIWLLKTKVRFPELKTLQLMLDPEADIPNGCLRTAVKKMLTEYLFECSDMDTVPKSLLQALAVVNRSSRRVEHKVFPKEAVEEEVECIMIVSAHLKEIVWHWLPDYEFDQEFSDAYMEELEDSDDGNSDEDDEFGIEDDNGCSKMEIGNTQDSASHSSNSDCEESVAEYIPSESTGSAFESSEGSFHFTANRNVTRDFTEARSGPLFVTPVLKGPRSFEVGNNVSIPKCQVKIERDEAGENIGFASENQWTSSSYFSMKSTKFDDEDQKICRNRNQYLAFQEVSDETSMVAYNLIGHLLEKFAEETGLNLARNDRLYLVGEPVLQEANEERRASSEEKLKGSVIIEAVKRLMPSLQKSVLSRLEELMDMY